jgi:hypothetical protein
MAVSAGEAFVDVLPNLEGFAPQLAGGLEKILPEFGAKAGLLFFGGLIVAAGAELIHLGDSFAAAYGTIRAETGKTGIALQGLEHDFRSVYSNVPAGMGAVSDVIAGLNTRLGLTGKPLEALSTQVLNLSRVTKTDLNTNIALVPELLNNWNIPGAAAGKTLDMIFRASQQTGTGVDLLMQQGVKFGPVFRALNIPLSESIPLLAKLNQNGVDAGPIMMGLQTAFAKTAKGGHDAGAAIHDYLDQIKNAPTDQEAFTIASEHFSGRAAIKLVDALRSGKLNYQELQAAIAMGGDTINKSATQTESLGQKFDVLWHKIQVGLAPVAAAIVDGLGKGLDAVAPAVSKVSAFIGPPLKQAFEDVRGFVEKWWPDVVSGFNHIIGFVKAEWPGIERTITAVWDKIAPGMKAAFATISDVISTVVAMVKAHWPEIEQTIKTVISNVEPILVKLGDLFSKTMAMIQAIVEPILVALKWAWATFGSDILSSVSGTFNAIFSIIGGVIGFLSGIINFITAVFSGDWSGAWNAIQEMVSGVWQVIGGVIQLAWNSIVSVISFGLTALGAIWNAVWSVISSVVTAVWGVITGVISAQWSIITGIFNWGIGLITGAWNTLWDGLSGIVTGAWNAVEGAVKGAINAIVDLMNNGIDLLNSISIHISIDDPTGITGGIHWDWGGLGLPHINHLHSGGEFLAPPGQSEGLAMLRDHEMVFTPEQLAGETPVGGRAGTHIEGGINITAQTNADPHEIAGEFSWVMRTLST